MKHRCKLILLAIALIVLWVPSAQSQPPAASDTLIFYLQSIKKPSDTNVLKAAYDVLYSLPEEALVNDKITTEIINLKTKLEEQDYYDLMNSYFTRLIELNTETAYNKAIAAGKLFAKGYSNNQSKYGHYSLLGIIRNLRLPYRALGKLNEMNEYYSELEKKYIAANDSDAVSIAENVLSGSYFRLGLIEKSSYYQLKSISYLNDNQPGPKMPTGSILLGKAGKVNRYAVLGSYYITEKKPAIAEPYLNEAIRNYNGLDSPLLMLDAPFLFLQMARCKTLQKSDSSSYFYDVALKYYKMYNSPPLEYAHFYQEKGVDFISKNQFDSALFYIDKATQFRDSFHLPLNSYFGELLPEYHRGAIYLLTGKAKDAVASLQNEASQLRQLNLRATLIDCLVLLAKAYATAGDNAQAYKTLTEAFELKQQTIHEINDARTSSFDAEKKMQEKESAILLLDAQNKSNQKIKYYLFGIVGLLGLFVVGLAFFYSNKRKTNRELALKNERLAYTIQQLQATQAQLIQAEKMASLGELTAGIAHEIQNPLNFVNNFSEVNKELIAEMKEEIEKGNYDGAKAIAKDIEGNEEKINHHGKRADAIVKGMLQHSRSSSGQKEPTDINALCNEYLRLSFHGLRAKDKSFNAKIETSFDNSIGKVNIVPQDIGRVILNLINNAFYAVNEKKKLQPEGYEPTVTVSTKKENNKVLITVDDNGNGIPDEIKEKIFQPFFTTKPTGQGTGLGLSLSYDIITNAHGGELKVESKESEGTRFIIILPK